MILCTACGRQHIRGVEAFLASGCWGTVQCPPRLEVVR